MSPFKCSVCFQTSIKCPKSFIDLLIEFIRAFNKSPSCNDATELRFCQSCWTYLMQTHHLNQELNLKKEVCDAKMALLSSKILRGQGSLKCSGNNMNTWKELEGGSLARENNEDSDPEVRGHTPEGEEVSTEVATFSTSDSSPESETVETDQSTYDNKWLPKHLTIPNSPLYVKRLSEMDFIYKEKYPFQATELGFQCGLCSARCPFSKPLIWSSMLVHLRTWHTEDHKVRAQKVYQRFIEVAPNRFQYGKYTVEMIDGNYQCGECGVIRGPKPGCKNANILAHIKYQHENPPRACVCEYCGKVFVGPDSLRVHKISKHETSTGQFSCSDCGKIFDCRIKASTHQRKAHRIRQKFICEICAKEFGEKNSLRTHVACVHNGLKVKCKDCDKWFGSQVALNTHRHSHTGKKFTCDICGMDFTQNYSVTRHKKTAHLQ